MALFFFFFIVFFFFFYFFFFKQKTAYYLRLSLVGSEMCIRDSTRMAQMAGDKVGQYGSAANAALGRMFMAPQGISQPILENVRGPGGRFTAGPLTTSDAADE